MKKFVDVQANYTVSGVTGFVRGRLNNVEMSTEDIFKCLCCRATVIENVGGRKIKLTLQNYNKDNSPKAKTEAVAEDVPVRVEHVKEPEKAEETAPVETPVVEEKQAEVITAAEAVAEPEATSETTEEKAEETAPVEEDATAETIETDESTEEIPANVNVPRNKKHRH